MRVVVCGSRDWEDWDPLWRELRKLPAGSVIMHGDCRGADKMAGAVARQIGHAVIPYPADWEKHGKAAGPIRNQEMLRRGNPDLVMAFHADFDDERSGSGTADMVRRARAAGVEVRIIKG